MRILAAGLNAVADQAGGLAGGVSNLVAGLVFEGPAGTAFRERVQVWQKAINGEAVELKDLARRLLGAADVVEAEQRAAEQREREARERAEMGAWKL